mgnify:CR=1 FL=1
MQPRHAAALANGKDLAMRLLSQVLPSFRSFPPPDVDPCSFDVEGRATPQWGFCYDNRPRALVVNSDLIKRAAGDNVRPLQETLTVREAMLLLGATIAHECCHSWARQSLIRGGATVADAADTAARGSAQAAKGKVRSGGDRGTLWQSEHAPAPCAISLPFSSPLSLPPPTALTPSQAIWGRAPGRRRWARCWDICGGGGEEEGEEGEEEQADEAVEESPNQGQVVISVK